MIFIKQGKNISAIRYENIQNIEDKVTRLIKSPSSVPADAQIVGETWKYVNKDGSRDKRFSNNEKLPIALYADIEMELPDFTLDILISNLECSSYLVEGMTDYLTYVTGAN